MSVDIFQIGQTGLQAAEVGIATTGNNISNASTPGYSEEVSQQSSVPAQGYSFGFVGQGAQVSSIVRNYNALLASQINSTQSISSQLTTYSTQITPLDNTIANPSAGLSPVMQAFFSSLSSLSANPSSKASLQTAFSSAQTLSTQFQSLQNQLDQARTGVNSQIATEVNTINTDAQQLASVNQAIQVAYSSDNQQPPNSLLDQRDALVASLSQQTQVSVVKQGNQYNVFIGNGQPLVLGGNANKLVTTPSASNSNNLGVAYNINGNISPISENSLPGGALGGLFAFRTNSLDPIQNAIGQVAITLSSAMNAQNQLGQTISGAMGGALFNVAAPVVDTNSNNTGTAQISATTTNANALTTSDYTLGFDGTNYTVTNNTTNAVASSTTTLPVTVDGVTYNVASGSMAAGDSFLVRPTFGGAAGFTLATTDPTQIASAAPIATSVATTNTGSGVMTPGSVTTGYTPAAVSPPITLTYNSATNSLSGFPVGSTLSVTNNGAVTNYPAYVAGTAIPYTSGMTMTFNNMTVALSGKPANGDTYTIGPNTNAKNDDRNVLLMNGLETQNIVGGNTTFQGAYAQMVDAVGNTTSQLTTTGTTETNLLKAATAQQQSTSGVNMDEETVNLLQYQQVYEACGKVIQIASQNFSTILNLNR